MSRPLAARARMADSRPAPGPFTFTSTERTPCSWASCAAFWAATCAAKGVPLREPLKPMRPALDQARVFPIGSLMATMVLLNEAAMDAMPWGIFLRSLRLPAARRPPAAGPAAFRAVAICFSLSSRAAKAARGPSIRYGSFGVYAPQDDKLFLRSFLLAGDRTLARSLARARVRVRPLPANRQPAAMTHAAVAVDLHQPLDVEADVLAEVALHLAFVSDDLTNATDLVFIEVLDPRVAVDRCRLENLARARAADAEDVSESDLDSLVQRKINACDTCHVSPVLSAE